MTTEEAISIIERVEHTESKWPGTEDTLEALDMAIAALHAQQQAEANKPLTLDELREMDGEPVCVVVLDFSAEWRILECVDTRSQEKAVLFMDGSHEPLTEYGKKWLAYRHNPEEGTT